MARPHTVDIQGILSGAGQVLTLHEHVPLESFEGIKFPEPARIDLEMKCADRILMVEGQIQATAEGDCDACLEHVERQLLVEVDERLDPQIDRKADPFGEGNVLIDGKLDIADLARQVVLTVLPMGLRCTDDCKGLCGSCGANLNAGQCACNIDNDNDNGEDGD
ncbi:MAG TPA: DUF177 domain-containing protein [Candidatus Tumulicola sp.]|jgi:uncharacterized protein